MTDNKIIQSIKENGGWCQLHHSNNVAMINILGGRLLFYNDKLSFIEKFDLSTDSLKGYVVVLNDTKQRLKKAYWIKQILSISGKVINDGNLPDTIFAETLTDFFQKLISLKELHVLRLLDKEIKGCISNFSDSHLTVDISPPLGNSSKMNIPFSQIVCFELRTPKVNQLKWTLNGG